MTGKTDKAAHGRSPVDIAFMKNVIQGQVTRMAHNAADIHIAIDIGIHESQIFYDSTLFFGLSKYRIDEPCRSMRIFYNNDKPGNDVILAIQSPLEITDGSPESKIRFFSVKGKIRRKDIAVEFNIFDNLYT